MKINSQNSASVSNGGTINRRGHRGPRRGTERKFSSASSAQTSASSAVKLLLPVAMLCLISASAPAQEPSPSPSPQQQTVNVPSVAAGFSANPNKPLPALNRIGVD